MPIVALIAWVVTALGGFVLLATWVARGGPKNSRFSPVLIFGHFGLAAVGLVLWIIYVVADNDPLAWVAFVLLVPVAALGFTMLVRWLPTYRARATVPTAATTATAAADAPTAAAGAPAERHFPVAVVGAHGVLAVATVVLVLIAAIGS
jgi:manganese efflux pump family protein